jgi:hypothetical protein
MIFALLNNSQLNVDAPEQIGRSTGKQTRTNCIERLESPIQKTFIYGIGAGIRFQRFASMRRGSKIG